MSEAYSTPAWGASFRRDVWRSNTWSVLDLYDVGNCWASGSWARAWANGAWKNTGGGFRSMFYLRYIRPRSEGKGDARDT